MFGRGVAVNPELLAFPQGTQMSLNFSKSLSGSGVTRFSVSRRPCMYLAQAPAWPLAEHRWVEG